MFTITGKERLRPHPDNCREQGLSPAISEIDGWKRINQQKTTPAATFQMPVHRLEPLTLKLGKEVSLDESSTLGV
jgi:hypothetical protein